MSRKLFALLLSEIKLLRIVCKSRECGAVLEIPASRLDVQPDGVTKCSRCGETLAAGGLDNPFSLLARAAVAFKRYADKTDVEFVVPDEG